MAYKFWGFWGAALALAGRAAADREPPRLTIDLDTEPAHRWDAILTTGGYNASLWAAIPIVARPRQNQKKRAAAPPQR